MTAILNLKDFLKQNEVFYIARSLFYSDIMSPLHTHDFAEIVFVEKGIFVHEINGEKDEIPSGSIQFIYPEDVHGFSAKKNKDAIITNLAFYFSRLDDTCKQFFLKKRMDNQHKALPYVQSHDYQWTSLYTKLSKIKQLPQAMQHYAFHSIIYDYIYLYTTSYVNSQHHTIIPRWLYGAKKEMEKQENLLEGLPRFIELSKKSQEHLTRQMKKHYGLTPVQWINQLKLERMETLLLSTNMDILDIIYEVGFHNVSYCYALFKKKNACAPKEFREKNKRMFHT